MIMYTLSGTINKHKGMHGGVCGGRSYNDFWQYQPDSDKWVQLPNFPGGGRDYGVMVADPQDTSIYYGTGYDNGTLLLADWWVYKCSTKRWTQLDSFPGGGRFFATGFYANGNIYVGTGDNNDNKVDAANDMWQYNPTTSTWTSVASVPGVVRRQACSFTINNYGFVSGGCYGATTTTAMNDMWKYDAINNKWTQEASYPPCQCYSSVGFTIGNMGYIGTGTIGLDDTSAFWQYTASDSVLSVTNIVNDNGISVYPDPTSGITNFKLRISNDKDVAIEVYNLLGEKVLSTKPVISNSSFVIDLQQQISGVYFYRIIADGATYTGKLLIVK